MRRTPSIQQVFSYLLLTIWAQLAKANHQVFIMVQNPQFASHTEFKGIDPIFGDQYVHTLSQLIAQLNGTLSHEQPSNFPRLPGVVLCDASDFDVTLATSKGAYYLHEKIMALSNDLCEQQQALNYFFSKLFGISLLITFTLISIFLACSYKRNDKNSLSTKLAVFSFALFSTFAIPSLFVAFDYKNLPIHFFLLMNAIFAATMPLCFGTYRFCKQPNPEKTPLLMQNGNTSAEKKAATNPFLFLKNIFNSNKRQPAETNLLEMIALETEDESNLALEQ